MPSTGFLRLEINGLPVDIGDLEQTGVNINYILEYPESWENKQSSDIQNVTLPATRANDKAFNTFHDIAIQDLTPGQIYRNLMPFRLQSNGVTILQGKARLNSGTYTDRPEAYNIGLEGGNGDWLLDGQNLTLWDCVNPNPHDFTVANIQDSWQNYDTSESWDYVYAPVRYRQPFDGTSEGHGADDTVNIYMLRPSLSVYWLIIRGFRQLGYTVKSDFFRTPYFRGLVMPWTWGDFFDINSKITDGLSFKAVGATPVWFDFGTSTSYSTPPPGTTSVQSFLDWGVWVALDPGSVGGGCLAVNPQPDTSVFYMEGPVSLAPADRYIISYTGAFIPYTGSGCLYLGNTYSNFRINNVTAPDGYDNFSLYSFDDTTGTMRYDFTLPGALSAFIGSGVTANFQLNLYAYMDSIAGKHCYLYLEVNHYNGSGGLITSVLDPLVFASGGAGAAVAPCTGGGGISGGLGRPSTIPYVYNFSVTGLSDTHYVTFRLVFETDGSLSSTADQTLSIFSSFYMNMTPAVTGTTGWEFNFNTGKWEYVSTIAPQWQLFESSIQMTGLQLELGGQVHFQWYDSFRNYKFFDFLGGLVEKFDLEVQTNPIDKTVTIEPFSNASLSDGTSITGYFDTKRVVDWTDKQDLGLVNEVKLFADSERQLDFSDKQDGSDGGQNIWAARYKGAYLNNVLRNTVVNGQINNGVIAGVPGASRYMLPNRFAKGNKQKTNRFFSSVLHYKHQPWANLWPATPAPQLICIIPENVSDSSASAITQVFEPKLAFYAGTQAFAGAGAWRWIGDPASPYTDGGTPNAIGFNLPYMFAVDYTGYVETVPGQIAPVLTYCDQNVNGVVVPGLMRTWFLKRMAIMRNGQLLNANFRLNLNDICRFEHREVVNVNNKGIFALVGIENYNPLSDASSKCTMWKMVDAEETDVDNSFPSQTSILTSPSSLPQYDLRYAQMLLFYTDIPQV